MYVPCNKNEHLKQTTSINNVESKYIVWIHISIALKNINIYLNPVFYTSTFN